MKPVSVDHLMVPGGLCTRGSRKPHSVVAEGLLSRVQSNRPTKQQLPHVILSEPLSYQVQRVLYSTLSISKAMQTLLNSSQTTNHCKPSILIIHQRNLPPSPWTSSKVPPIPPCLLHLPKANPTPLQHTPPKPSPSTTTTTRPTRPTSSPSSASSCTPNPTSTPTSSPTSTPSCASPPPSSPTRPPYSPSPSSLSSSSSL